MANGPPPFGPTLSLESETSYADSSSEMTTLAVFVDCGTGETKMYWAAESKRSVSVGQLGGEI